MTTCKVLRCINAATATLQPYPEYDGFKIPLCGAHDAEVGAGKPWILDGDMGVPVDDGPPMAGYTIRMGEDMPTIVTSYSVGRIDGHEKGITLTLRGDGPGTPTSSEFWISEQMGQGLGEFFQPRPA